MMMTMTTMGYLCTLAIVSANEIQQKYFGCLHTDAEVKHWQS